MFSNHRTACRRSSLVVCLLLVLPVSADASSAGAAPTTVSCGAWAVAPSPASRADTSYLYGVSGTSSTDVWAVGYAASRGGDRRTSIRHWNGTGWSAVPSPNGPHGGALYAVTALSTTNAWAVGDGPLVEHWNGSRWSIIPSPRVSNDPRSPAWLRSIAAISANDIWAAGTEWSTSNLTLIEHWNGRRWSLVPGPGRTRLELTGLAATSADDIWAVGPGGRDIDRAAAEHWNGSQWTRQPAPGDGLAAVAAVSSRDAWAVGGGTIDRWNGVRWTRVAAPHTGTPISGLTDIAVLSPRDVWTVGFAGRPVAGDGYAEHPLIERWNGSAWTLVRTPRTGFPDSQLLGITAVSARILWAVGFAGKHRSSSNHTLIERYIRC